MFKPETDEVFRNKVELGEAEKEQKADQQHQRKQADQLVDIAKAATLFHAPDSICYADVKIKGHRRRGQSAIRVSSDGSHESSSCGPTARRTQRPCSRR
jgi:hypothetical protein